MIQSLAAAASFIVSAFSFYMAFLSFHAGDGGVYLFAAFGLFSGFFFAALMLPFVSKKDSLLGKIAGKLTGKPRPVTFVSHRFMMTAIVLAGLFILAAILVPLVFQ